MDQIDKVRMAIGALCKAQHALDVAKENLEAKEREAIRMLQAAGKTRAIFGNVEYELRDYEGGDKRIIARPFEGLIL